MSWETAIGGRLYEALDVKIVHNGGCWVEQTYLKGKHPQVGSIITGETGIETVSEALIPDSLVNPAIIVNGKSNAILQHMIAPEFQHLIEQPAQQTPALELILGQEALVSQDTPLEVRQAA